MAQLTLMLVLVAATVVLAPVAQRIAIPYPVMLLIFGLLLAFLPGLPVLSGNPDLILPLVLPPLLFAAARRTSWREFWDNRRAIGLLAVALVGVTAFVVGATLHALVPGVPLTAAIAIGATVAPPDPVTATAVARTLRLPRRLRTTLEGEGLVNDATALVLYEVAVAATVSGAFAPWHAGGTLAVAIAVGIGVGLASAAAARWLNAKLPAHPAGSALVLILPFATYAAANAVHGSGVLAVVTLALAMSRYGDAESSHTRLVTGTTWEIIELVVSGAAFAYVGLALRSIALEIPGSLTTLIGQGLAISLVVVSVRFLWIFSVASVDERLRRRRREIAEPVGWREMTVASWAGMRGVVTLVAAIALPLGPPAFPERQRLVFIAFSVIIITLLVQGLTLPTLVKWLGVSISDDDRDQATQQLIGRARDAGFRRLQELQDHGDVDQDTLEQARENADRMWHSIGFKPGGGSDRENAQDAEHAAAVSALKGELLTAAREEVVGARTESGIDPTIVDLVLRRLDARGVHPE